MPTAYINIGSNQGDREANIARAVALIADTMSVVPLLSDPVESHSWGYESANEYLNVGMTIDTQLPPEHLLDTLLEIEHSISPISHRRSDGSYADRIIDIDLIACDSLIIPDAITPAGRHITLPHPRMHLRPFVLIPLMQLAPDWIHPLLHRSASEMLDSMSD